MLARASRIRYVPLMVGAALVGLFFAGLLITDPSRLPSAHKGKALPAFALPGLGDMEGFGDTDLATGQPVLLNVWASWCGPCRVEHPLLMALAARGVAIYGLNYKDNEAAARRFLGRLGNPYHAVGVDASGTVALDLGVYGVPETFVLDGKGRVLRRHVGPVTQDGLRREILPYLHLYSQGEGQ